MSTAVTNTSDNAYGIGYTAESNSVWAKGTVFEPNLDLQTSTAEDAIQSDTLDIAQDYVNADAANRERLVRAILGDAATKMAIDDLVAIETLIQNTLNEAFVKDSAHAPVFKVVDHGDVDQADLPEGADDTFLQEGVEGAFITPEDSGTGGGIILLSRDLLAEPERLGEVALEELGEALAVHVQKEETWDFVSEKYEDDDDIDFDVEEGDVGARIASTIQEERIEEHTWDDSDSDLTSVMWMGSKTDAIAADDTRTPEELAAEWGVNVDTVTGMIPIAETITDGPPWTAESFAEVEGWDLVVGAYGTDGVMTFNNLLRAFVEQAVYLGQSGSNPDIPGRGDPGVVPESLPDLELAAEWGHPLSDVSEARAIAREIYDRNGFTGDQGFTLGDHDSITWDPMIRIYGQDAATDTNDPVLQVDELARAITEGAFTTTVNSAGEVVFDAVNLESVSTTTIVDATWAYVERNTSDGAERTDITAAHLQEASDYILGPVMGTDVLVAEGEEAPVEPLSIFSEEHYGLIEGLFADQPSANGTVDRFSKDAVQDIWDTGVFLRGRDFPAHSNLHPIPNTGDMGYALSEANAADVTPPETSTDPDDPGLIDQGYSAFGDPEGAENISMHFTDGDDTYHGFDVLHQRYTLADEPDVTFYTRMHAEEGEDFLVVEALKVNEETGDIQIFDSEGTETFTGNRSDFAPETRTLTVDEILHDGSDAEAELVEWAGDDLLYSAATSQVSYVLYSDPDRAIDEYTYADTTADTLMIRYVVPTYDEATGTMIYSEARSVEADSPEGKNIITAADYAGKADLLAQEVEADETGEGVSDTVVFDIDTTDVDPDTGQVAMADSVVMGAAAAAGAQQSDAAAAAVAFFVPEIIVPAAIAGVAYGGWKASHQFAEWQMNQQSGKVHVIEATMNAEDAPGGSGGGASADTTHTPNSQRGPTVGTVRKMPPGEGSDGDDPVPPPGGTIVKTHYIEMPDTLATQMEQLDNIVVDAPERFNDAIVTFARFRGALDDFVEFRQTGGIIGQPDVTLAQVRANLQHRATQFIGAPGQDGPATLLQTTMRDLRTLDATMGDSLSAWFQENLTEGGFTARGIEQMRRVITLVSDVGTLETGITATNGRMMDLWEPFAQNFTGTDIADAALATVRTALDGLPMRIAEPPLQSNSFWARIAAGIEAMSANPEAHRLGEEGEI